MTRPSTQYTWATSANYATGPDAGTPTKVAPSAGLQAEGFEPGQEPGAQNFNEVLSNLTLWIAFLATNNFDRIILPTTATKSLSNAQNDDVDVSGVASLAAIALVHLTGGGANQSLTGLAGGTDGAVLILMNLTGSTLQVRQQSTSSSPGNRITTPGALDVFLPNNAMFAVRWDATPGCWTVVWMGGALQPVTRHEFPEPFWVSAFQVDDELTAGDSHSNPALRSTGAGAAFVALKVPQGYRLTNITALGVANGVQSLTFSAWQIPKASGTAGKVMHSKSTTSATAADISLTCYARTGPGISVVVSGGLGSFVFTRTVGSWITDGFEVGQYVNTSGYSNGANNLSGSNKTVSAVTATVLTIADGSLGTPVGETSSNGVHTTLSSAIDSTQHMTLLLNSGAAAGLGIRSLRYTYQPI